MNVHMDYSHCMASNIGPKNGVPDELLNLQTTNLQQTLSALNQRRTSGELGFFDLFQTTNTVEIDEYVKETLFRFEDIVVIGIGGSSLGNRTLHQALNHPLIQKEKHFARVHICDNIDPDALHAILQEVKSLPTTQFQVVTKSGSTAETLANFMICYQILKNAKLKPSSHIIAITDPQSGDLFKLAKQEGFKTFPVPPNVGGRFSVLTAVGLLSAAYSGIRIESVLEGAREMSVMCQEPDLQKNPAALIAFLLTYLCDARAKSNVIFMPYSYRLKSFAQWFCQLWAESLGKQGKGQTPIATEGAADQHSQIQLYMEGPEDKVIQFLTVREPIKDFVLNTDLSADSINYLKGKSLQQLFLAEHAATATALARSGRPNFTIEIDRITEQNIGALFYLFEFATAMAGEFWKINAFDQPGVEEGKRLTYAMMGRAGYESKKAELDAWQKNLKRYRI
ncbi:glucose-6-phosphate isomerase [bacterium]|nr:glucose-6-phosphate isomerase [bacterium]